MNRVSRLFAGLGAALALGLAASGAVRADDPLKVAFVYTGPVGDHGWSYQHNVGRQAVEKAFGDKVKTTYVENVSDGPDAERVIEQLAAGGAKLIFTTSFGFMNPTLKVAKRHPEVKFEHATGFKRADNLATYNARFYEGRYVAGVVAAKMSKSGTIGYIASFPIPEVVMGVNAAYLGAKTVNPNIKIKIIWVSSWFDPGKEADAAKALINQGADVLMQHTDSPAAMKLAEERGVYAIGQSSDMADFGPRAQLTSVEDHWDEYYIARVKAVMDGTWTSTDTWGGLKDGMVVLAPYGKAVPEDVARLADETKQAIVDGRLKPFTGPLNKQDGSVWLKQGESAPDKDLLSMNFYVEGVEGGLPK
ncbi:BMP family ABC transporter substrate-binding protein [Hansschlegelia plantiphila]|uniref:BMP family ABC transporter substrate-binding protein n=1 Tax=Hansschlegelia plantiphila TaxID=374655 RepID=A0A9W6IYZ8_9HYPH|nr:BMP family ABC transporter substrate-binding protein [Hansschlegelia plantiphila]GLK66771.1 BMP family ABC transporter substrate-binding protein [Hansschlegelia plantiphila]